MSATLSALNSMAVRGAADEASTAGMEHLQRLAFGWIESSGANLIFADALGQVIWASDSARHFVGHRLGVGTALSTLVAPRYADRARRLLAQLWVEAERKPQRMQVPVALRETPDRRMTLRIHASVVRLPGAANDRVLALELRDMTESRLRDRLLKRLRQVYLPDLVGAGARAGGALAEAVRQAVFLRELSAISTTFVLVARADGIITYISPSAADQIGVSI
ncbi:MAG TPA: hypothetical protein VFK82_02095, partial [Burkholderiaceae bacterium]|nr:hypothetical protein [Burkholderiaceae bacterium]